MDFDLEGLDNLAKQLGMATFKEFSQNPAKYRQRHDSILEQVSHGSDNLRRHVDGYQYKFGLYTTNKLERIHEIIENEGYQLSDIELKPHVEQSARGNSKYKILVEFVVKDGAVRSNAK